MKRVAAEIGWWVGVLFCVVVQFAIISGSWLEPFINVVLLGVVLIFLYAPGQRFVATTLIAGFLLDALVPLPFGVYSIALVAPAVVMSIIQASVLRHRAAHSVIIQTIIATVLFQGTFIAALLLARLAGVVSLGDFIWQGYVSATWPQLIVHTVITGIVYMFFRATPDRLQDHFWNPTK